ncbi:hypothetical protein MPH_12000 [Macrophomina phaseolina MS6]|uniref:GAR domain-containing protein n=1 Tax=Macrophomina phaseolina (strain MS6) TaxID=1126212 RepID=K2RDK0_MACPH|nr:hypothetical protein MPH_12000 [Macrophomina phaseolina MS6]
MAYGERLDVIKEELEDLNMDELKGHILDMYPIERPRPGSGYGNKRAELHLLDDFSYVVTHTMLQALPCLSYLSQLTRVWSVRLMVLHEVPHFMAGLDDVTKAMRLGWDALDLPDDPQNSTKALDGWKEVLTETRDGLQGKITSLGRKLDRMLDALEGMNDVLPDNWIDDFEAIEADYSRWAADAQKRIFELDMLLSRPPEKLTRPTSARGADQPFDFGAHTPRKSLLYAENSEHRLLSDESGTGDKLAGSVPKLNRTNTTFGPRIAPHVIDRGHQRSRSRSEPDVQISPFKFAQRLETIEGTPTKPDRFRKFDLEAEQADSDDSDAIAESSVQESVERRASVTSIESFTRSQVKSVDIRRDSSSSNKQELQSINSSPRRRHSHPGGPLMRTEEEVLSSASSDEFPPLVDTPEVRIENFPSPTESQFSSPEGSPTDSPSLRPLPGRPTAKMPRPPLNSAMHKRRSKSQKVPIVLPSDSESDKDSRVFGGGNSPESPPKYLQLARKSQHRRISSATADLEQQIRRLITSVHAPIRLTSGDAEASPVESNSRRTVSGSRPPSSLRVSRKTSAQSITMSPVKLEHDRAQRHARYGDSDIKLYHLTQPGQAKPIKLFVRRVGENGERLMVRVGGGWADLGEYLRQYADHHARRVVSTEGKIEALGIQGTPEPVRPTSSHSNTGGSKRFLGTPNTSTPLPRSRPGSAMSNHSSMDRDEIGAIDSGASQRSWAGSEVGLAGPKTKKLDLSGEKLEWIEGMMNQAKMLGAREANNTRKVYLKHGGQGGM